MPYKNEHAARIREPSRFRKDTVRSKNIAPGIRIIIGKLKPKGKSMVVQAYRFNAGKYTAAEARAWLKAHGTRYILFEPAVGG